MANRTCSIEGCGSDYRIKRGWCNMHYQRWHSFGDPEVPVAQRFATPQEAFSARVERDKTTGCLVWSGNLFPGGYGLIVVRGRSVRAHRYAWEQANGPIPAGMQVDHVCYRRECVEVSHLRLASPAENTRNRSGSVPGSATGVRNVYPNRQGFRVSARKGGKTFRRGTFPTIEEAARVAEELRSELFGEFAGRG